MPSFPVRLAVLLLVGFLLLIARAQQPGPMFAFGSEPSGFPADVRAPSAVTPRLYNERPDVRVLQLVASMNAMWSRVFVDAGDDYERPRVEARSRAATEGCGADADNWAGIYCHRGARIVVDMANHQVLRAAGGDTFADDELGYTLAHEMGHHVQLLRGVARADDLAETVRLELHAQCLAGVWGRAAGRPLPHPESYGVDAEHGSAAEQHRWLSTGYARAHPADCDAVFER